MDPATSIDYVHICKEESDNTYQLLAKIRIRTTDSPSGCQSDYRTDENGYFIYTEAEMENYTSLIKVKIWGENTTNSTLILEDIESVEN